MICTLSEQQISDLRVAVFGDILDLLKTDNPFDIKAYTKDIYQELNETPEDEEVALQYARLVPSMIISYIGVSPMDMMKLLNKGVNFQDLAATIAAFEDPKTGFTAVKNYVSPIVTENQVKDLADAQKKKDSVTSTEPKTAAEVNPSNVAQVIEKDETKILKSKVNTANEEEFNAAKSTAMATADNEAISSKKTDPGYNVPQPALVPYFATLRNVIKKLFSQNDDNTKVRVGNTEGIYLSAIAASEIEKRYPGKGYLRPGLQPKEGDGGVMLMLTDKAGNPLTFDLDPASLSYGEYDADGKPLMFFMRKIYDKMLDEKGNVTKLFKKANDTTTDDYDIIDSMIRNGGFSGTEKEVKARAENELLAQLNLINDIRNYVSNNPAETVLLNVIGGSLGYVSKDKNVLTPMAEMASGEVLSFSANPIANTVEGIRAGDITFTTKSTGTKLLVTERPFLKDNPSYIEKIVSLLFDDISTDEGKISVSERISFIAPYIKLGDRNGTINLDLVQDEDGSYRVKFNDTTIYSSNEPETREAAKQLLTGAFGQVVRGADVTLALDKRRGIVNDPKSPATAKENAAKYLALIDEKSTEPVAGRIRKEGEQYFFYGYPRLNANNNLVGGKYKKVTLTPNKDGSMTAKVTFEDYNQDYLVPTSLIPYQLTADKKIRTMNAYLTYDITTEGKAKISPVKEEKKEAAPVKEAVKEVAGNRRKTLSNLIGLDKRLEQKNINPKEAAEKIAAAKTWWSTHPLSKLFSLEEMFEIINKEDPRSIARWTLNGITLYKGSDYTDLYHEAWHAFSQTFLTPAQRDALYAEARKNTGVFTDYKGHRVSFKKATDMQIEEYIAEEFRAFMLTGKKDLSATPVKKSIFQKIWDILKALFEGTTVTDLVASETANKNLYDLFNKLSVGDLSTYTFSYKNAQFGHGLNQTLTAYDENEQFQHLSLEDSRTLVSIVDSMLSENIDIVVQGQQIRQQKSGSTKWATSLLKDPAKLKLLYTAVKQQMEEVIEGLNAKYETTTDTEAKALIERQLNLINWATVNFGNTDNLTANRPIEGAPVKGLIGYHLLKSKIIDDEFKDLFFDEDNASEEDVFNKGREGYDKSGNEVSLKDQASKEIIFLLSGLHKLQGGKPVYLPGTTYEVEIDGKKEIRGIKEIEDFDVVWNTLVKNLSGTLSAEVMYGKLLKLAKNSDLPFAQLINEKLGSVYSNQSSEEFNIWTNFWQTFNKAYIPLLQTTVEIEVLDRGNAKEKRKLSVKPGRASTNNKQVERAWSNAFATKTTEYIKPDKGGIRQLDLKAVIDNFKDLNAVYKNKLGFLQAIGFSLEDNEDIRLALERGAVNLKEVYGFIEAARYRLNDKGEIKVLFRDIKDYLRGIVEDNNNYYYPKGSAVVAKSLYKANKAFISSKVYNSILELQSRYSAKFSNFMVSNAEGNTQFEHSLNNTMSVMVSAVNESPTYDDLVALPWMKHLDYRRNPKAKHSAWLKAMYPDFGKKAEIAPGVPKVLTLENLSGVAVSVDGIFDERLGTSSASADSTTKVLMDFHNLILKGVPELMRHSDKSTSYSLFVDQMNFINSKGTSLYAIPAAFYNTENEKKRTDGEKDLMREALLPNLIGEYETIMQVRAKNEAIDTIKKANKVAAAQGKPEQALPAEDYNYLKRASDFVSFQFLSDKVKNSLYELMSKGVSLEEAINDDTLRKAITDDIYSYMDKLVSAFEQTLASVSEGDLSKVISEGIYTSFPAELKKLDKKGFMPIQSRVNEALIKAFVYNSWIHNIESTNFLYGDPAQYNMAKEEFHKRNAGASSTGTLYRTDNAAMDYINSVVGRKLTQKLASSDDRYKAASTRAYNGTFDTAVIEDNEIRSAYFKDYSEALIASEMTKGNLSRKDAEAIVWGVKKDDSGKIVERGTSNKPLKGSLLYAYENMNEGDGQGWITFDSYRILLKLEGIWSDAQENLYNKIVNDEVINPSDVINTFPVQKLQYWGALQTDEFALTAFHKFSVMPLIPTVIKDTNLKTLHEKMMREGIDYATFVSGSKVAKISQESGYDKIYSDDNRTIQQETPFTKNTIFLNYLKNQLAIAPKFKEKVIFSTQLRKLIENGLVENGLPVDFMPGENLTKRKAAWTEALEKGTASTPLYNKYKAYESLVDLESRIKKRELIDEIGWSIDESGVAKGDIKNLVDFIHREFSDKDLADHEMAFIKVNPDGKLDTDLSLSLSATKIEKMLNALVAKRLINQKVTGEGLIQASGALFENTNTWLKARSGTKEELKQHGTNDLPTYNSDTIDFTEIYKDFSKANLAESLKQKENTARTQSNLWSDSNRYAIQAEIQYLKAILAGNKPEITVVRKNTSAMKVKIAMQGTFKLLLDLPAVKEKAKADGTTRIQALNALLKDDSWLDQANNRRMVTMIGVRIPVQGLNSIEFMEVYEFLPEEAGNIIVPPAEIVAKSGSDFDVDKLTVMMPAIAKYDNEVTLVKYDASIKESKNELKKQLAKAYMNKADAETIYDALLTEAKEAKVFKTLTEEEKLLLKQIKTDFVDVDNELKLEIQELTKIWEKLNKAEGRKTFAQSVEATNIENQIIGLATRREILLRTFTENKNQYKTGFFSGKFEAFKDREKEGIRKAEREISSLKRKVDAVSTKGVENNLIQSIVDILSDPVNFVNLITPNSTDAVQPLAEELAPFVSDYSPKANGEKSIAGNRIFEYEYNLYKHQSNKVGKEVLGMGAVDNTFNIIFNRVGAAMKSKVPMYDFKGDITGYYDQKLYMAHNKVEDESGEAISLSDIMDAEGKNNIADIISQLMNGWVDVAKDSWVFNIQGNKELAPVLLFLVQAGVPFRTAVLFLSQPVIRRYAENIRKKESSFAPLFEREGANAWNMVEGLLANYKGVEKEMLQEVNSDPNTKKAFHKLHTNVAIQKAFGKEELTAEDLEDMLKNPGNNARKELALLRHFNEILNMSNAVKEIKVNLNPDTKRSSNLYEAMTKQKAFDKASGNERLSDNLANDILGDTVIKSFNIQKFQVELFKDLFKLSTDPRLLSGLSGVSYKEKASVGLTDTSDFGNQYRSDFMSFVFQNKLKHFDSSNMKYYKGYNIEKAEDVKQAHFTRGVFFKEGKMYLDKKRMQFDYENLLYTGKSFYRNLSPVQDSYKNLSLATVPTGTFNHFEEYAHFVIEREYLRSIYKNADEVSSRMDFLNDKELLKRTFPLLEDETLEDYEERITMVAFEEFLKNKALENIWNTKALFASDKPFADKLLLIQNKYGEDLIKDYPVLGALKVNSATRKGVTYSNVTLIEKLDDDLELIELYYSNIVKLANPSISKVPNAQDNAFISEYFRKLAVVAYLQSGQNTKSSFSITRIMPDEEYLAVMKDGSENVDNAYSDKSLSDYKTRFFSENSISKGSLRNRFKDYTIWGRNIFDKTSSEKSVVVKKRDMVGVTPISIPYTEVPGDLLTAHMYGEEISALAKTKQGKIYISQDVNPVIFFDYFTGKTNTKASEQKKAVLAEITKEGYDLASLQKLINSPSRVKMFLILHEQSHIDNRDSEIYFKEGSDLMTPDKVAIETRATIDGIVGLKAWIADATEDKRMSMNYAGTLDFNFEGIAKDNMELVLVNNLDKTFVFASPKEAKPYASQGNILAFSPILGKTEMENKQVVDNFVQSLKDSGKAPVFPKEGLAQEWIGNVKEGAVKTPLSPETFLYLSRKLYEEFQWINPNWVEGFNDVLRPGFSEYAIVQSTQEVSDESVEEFIKSCK